MSLSSSCTMIKVRDLFDIHSGVAKSSLKIFDKRLNDDFVFYLRPSQTFLGTIDGFVDKNSVKSSKIFNKETLYVSTDGEGSHTYSYVSEFSFVPNSNVVALLPKVSMNIYQKLFYSQCITKNRFKFNYDRKPKMKRIKNILIPDISDIPKWVANIKLPKMPSKKPFHNKKTNLQDVDWELFKIDNLFTTIEPTKGTTTNELIHGNEIPYIAAKKINNGLEAICSKEGNEQFITQGNCIVFIQLGAGSTGYTTYQGQDFIGMNGKTSCGYNNNLNKYNALFLVSILDLERPKYSYGRGWNGDRLKNTQIKLPIDSNGSPDWQFMENYIKSLPYSGNL
jgi:hypothetical protein